MNQRISRGDLVKFTCTRCGGCCSSGPNVALTTSDICRIAKYMNTNWRNLAGKYFYVVIADHIPVAILRGIRDKCVFLRYNGNTATCTIYPVRPHRCRLYPFIPISPSEINNMEISSRCPGVGIGDVNEPPWRDLEVYIKEVREHYVKLFEYIFTRKIEPLKALEQLLDDTCIDT